MQEGYPEFSYHLNIRLIAYRDFEAPTMLHLVIGEDRIALNNCLKCHGSLPLNGGEELSYS